MKRQANIRPGWMTYGDWTFLNHPIFPTVFQGFLYINLQHIIATHDVSHVWKGVGEHRQPHFTMTRRKSNFFPSQKYEWVPSSKTLPKSLYCYYSPTVHYFILDWTIYKSIFYGISFPASPSLKCHSTHVVLRALSSVHSCNSGLPTSRSNLVV